MKKSDSNVFELLSTNMYYISSNKLRCKIHSEKINDEEISFVSLLPWSYWDTKSYNIELNNSCLTRGCMIHGVREFIEKKETLNEEAKEKFLSHFRGIIIGYPYFSLSINSSDEIEEFTCDVIRIKGGFKNPFPYVGYNDFSIDFLIFESDGKITKYKSFNKNDIDKSFEIRKVPKIGQVMATSNVNQYSTGLLNPTDLADFIDGVKSSYMGRPPHKWNEIIGTIENDSEIPYLNIRIDFENHMFSLSYHENLFQRTYEIISHASMDPWNEERTDSRDRIIWATFSFDENELVHFIKKLSQSEIVENITGNFIKFKSPVKKSFFTKLTGIHLFETISESSY